MVEREAKRKEKGNNELEDKKTRQEGAAAARVPRVGVLRASLARAASHPSTVIPRRIITPPRRPSALAKSFLSRKRYD